MQKKKQNTRDLWNIINHADIYLEGVTKKEVKGKGAERISEEIKSESESHSVMSDTLRPHGLCSPWNSSGRNTRVDSLSLLQGIFPTQGSNPGLRHCRQIICQLSHKGSPRTLEWVAYPFSNKSS